jgi:DNA (cytosine-5)-methyltransferase 1
MHKNKLHLLGKLPKTKPNSKGMVKKTLVKEGWGEYGHPSGAPKFISLFSGAMGLDLGLESAGFECVGCLELDKRACQTIRRNRPNIPVLEDDIRNWNQGSALLKKFGLEGKDVALIVGGPPCPSFSTAGKRQAFNDPRGQVMFDFLKVVNEIRPPFFVMENVRGILSAAIDHVPLSERDDKVDFDGKGSVLALLNTKFAEMGYTVTAQLVNAANYGTPQKRERVVFIGSRDGLQIPMPVGAYSPSEGLFQRRWRTLGDALEGLVDPEPEFIPFSKNRAKFLSLLQEGENWRSLPPEMQEEALGGAYSSTGGRVGFFRRLSFSKPSPTVPTSPIQKSTCLCHPTELRSLSVKEYARVQQFPDNWIFEGSLVDRYRQIGNAVPVGLGYVIGTTIFNYLKNLEKNL